MNLYKKLYESEDDKKNNHLLYRFFRVLHHHLLSLVGLNLMFVISILPIITIGPGIHALSMTMMDIIRDKPIHVGKSFVGYYKENFVKNLLWSVWLIPIIIILYIVKANNIISLISYVFGIYSIFFINLSICQSSMLNLNKGKIYKNSLLLLIAEPKSFIMLIVFTVIPTFFLFINIYIGSTFLLFIHFSYVYLVICLVNYSLIEKYLIKKDH